MIRAEGSPDRASIAGGGRAGTSGERIYTKRFLSIYDVVVLGISLPWVWGCPSRRLLALYDDNVGHSHLDTGVGTGYFLARCRFPDAQPGITLLDLNPNCLQRAAARLDRYRPRTVLADVSQPLPPGLGKFDSVGMSLLLHCLPGSMVEKSRVFGRLKAVLREGGVLFGATVLGDGNGSRAWSRVVSRYYNRLGIFSNLEDDAVGLEAGLARHFSTFEVRRRGWVALFVGRA